MKVCPKCQTFYDDGALGFCADDGVPLIPVPKAGSDWTKGKRFLEESKRLLRKKSQIKLLRKTVGYSVTTVIFSAVVLVIAANTIIFLASENKEIGRSDLPKDTTTALKKPVETPQTPAISSPDPIEPIKTPTAIPTVTPSPKPCNEKEEKTAILNQNTNLWSEQVEKQRLDIERIYVKLEKQYGTKTFMAMYSTHISISPECTRAGVTVSFELFAEIQGVKQAFEIEGISLPKTGTLKYNCKKFEKWICQDI